MMSFGEGYFVPACTVRTNQRDVSNECLLLTQLFFVPYGTMYAFSTFVRYFGHRSRSTCTKNSHHFRGISFPFASFVALKGRQKHVLAYWTQFVAEHLKKCGESCTGVVNLS